MVLFIWVDIIKTAKTLTVNRNKMSIIEKLENNERLEYEDAIKLYEKKNMVKKHILILTDI